MENPKIRFKGFTKDWEQRKLGDMGSTYTGLSGKTKEDFGHGDAKFITYMNVFSNPVANLDMTESVEIDSKQNCVKAGDVFFTTSSETPEEVGMSSVMPENADNIYLNSFCFGYRPTEKFDLNYLAYVLRTESFRKEMTFLAQGISRYNISKNKVMEVEIPIPSLDEQSRVGQYFKNLDTLITLHQRKCEQTKNLKKYMLQKMFPQNGAKVPEIRFNGFTHDWEQRKLGDVFEQTSNLVNPKEDEIELWSLTVEDGLTKKSDRYNREFLVKKDDNFKEVRPGDIVYNPMNMTLGAVGYNGMAKSVAVSGYYTTMVAKENYDTYYINTWLKSPLAIRLYRTYATGSLIEKQRVQFPTLSIIPVTFPKYEEQTKIGSYFHSLDNLITLHQRKCDELKKMKKYMLQNMFI